VFGTLYGRYYGDYFGRLEIVFVTVVFGRAWVDQPSVAFDLAASVAIIMIEAEQAAPQAIGIVNVDQPSGAIDISHSIGIVDVEAEPYDDT
jgi:hypothetical protein